MVKISILSIILTIILSVITIYLSAISSARRASKVSPIEALKSSNDIKIKSKKLKVPSIISNLFKTGGELAYKNLKRSKKKYRTTIVSLSVSIFIFITMNSLLTNMFGITNNYYEDFEYNMLFYCSKDDEENINKTKKLNNIDELFLVYEAEEYLKIKDLSHIVEIPNIELEEDGYYDEETDEFIKTGEGKVSSLQILALDNDTYKKYVKKAGLNYEKVKNAGILCDEYKYYDEKNKLVSIRRYNYSVRRYNYRNVRR